MSRLEDIAERINSHLADKYQAREIALQECRKIVRHAANAIRSVHRGEMYKAISILAEARVGLERIREVLKEHPDVYYAGFVQDAEKEYAEAAITFSLVAGEIVPDPQSLNTEAVPYLHGLGEAAGELRRYILDAIRREDFSRCEELLDRMEEIYTVLLALDFPDGMTASLRRTTDMVRGILEKTRGDLTLSLRQRHLEAMLKQFQERTGS